MEKVYSSTLLRVDRNGSKHYEEVVTCDRCGGSGTYYWGAVINGNPQYSGVCFKCNGCGAVTRTRIERTAEYAAKLEAKRAAKAEERRKAYEAELAQLEAARRAEEDRIRAERARSQWVGQIGQRITVECTLDHKAWYEVTAFCGYGTETRYVYTFRDAAGNAIVWKTGACCDADNGDRVTVTGTIKAHDEYDGEKQTVLSRCKVKVLTA